MSDKACQPPYTISPMVYLFFQKQYLFKFYCLPKIFVETIVGNIIGYYTYEYHSMKTVVLPFVNRLGLLNV